MELSAAGMAALAAGMVAVLSAGCGRDAPPCEKCGTVVVAATGEPTTLFPPAVSETVGRDIGDQVYERLADLAPGGAPIDSAAYQPRLASKWERIDSLTWRFHIRPGARWQDGSPVTSERRSVLVRRVQRLADRRSARGPISPAVCG